MAKVQLKESTQMSRMVEDLLLLARSDSDSLPLEMEVLPAPTFMAEVAGRAEALSRERGASFVAKLSGGGELRADPTSLEQAVLILVDNAAKYSPSGRPVTLLSTTESGELAIRVEDRGPGIPEEELSRVFERFYRADKARERKRGAPGWGSPSPRPS
jgi:two-component system, OmpR family, sensor histidine kinase VicK